MAVPQREQRAMVVVPCRMLGGIELPPVEPRAQERRSVVRIGQARELLLVREAHEARELFAPPARHGGTELGTEIAEELERRRRAVLLSHEAERRLRREP